jgi:hypothetical protein
VKSSIVPIRGFFSKGFFAELLVLRDRRVDSIDVNIKSEAGSRMKFKCDSTLRFEIVMASVKV